MVLALLMLLGPPGDVGKVTDRYLIRDLHYRVSGCYAHLQEWRCWDRQSRQWRYESRVRYTPIKTPQQETQ